MLFFIVSTQSLCHLPHQTLNVVSIPLRCEHADGEGAGYDSSRLSSSRFHNGSARDGSSVGGSSPQTPHLASRGSSPQNPAGASGSAAGAPPKAGGAGTIPRRGGLELSRMPTAAHAAAGQREPATSLRTQVCSDDRFSYERAQGLQFNL